MKPENPDAKLIFAEALRLTVPAERLAYLERACAGNQELRQEVESLLTAYAQAGDFLGLTRQAATLDLAFERTGTMVGRYKLLEKIGEGGFGTVWMAEQEEPVRRRVALKIIKPGMDTREVVARFEAERQALAMMDHPNIARVFDGGATENARPYFVMELVRGVTITAYCDSHHLPPRERLELFIQVSQAVQHAHQKGVIHRDLKPSNILVSLQDGRPVPKVIDFGVAKATAAPLTDKTLFTRFHQFLGTPAYMSPEQAGLDSADIDTRSDIYSLGVLLYELLTGRTPFDVQKLLQEGYEAMLRVIREAEPAKPSTRLSTLTAAELEQVAAARRTEPNRLGRLVRGDLDWIVMKALEKERGRRYASAGDFAKDLERYLRDEPVEASPPSAVYRARRFLKRNRLLVVSAGSIGLILLLAVPISLSMAWFAMHERQNAVSANLEATVRAEEAHQRLVRIDVANGVRAMETHDAFGAQVWFAEALRQDGPGASAERMHRFRLGALPRTTPRLVQLWNHTAPIQIAAFSPDGHWALTAGTDHKIRLWNGLSGQPGPILSHPTNITHAVVSGDSRKVLTICSDYSVRVWDVATGELAAPPLPHETRVHRAFISPDGRRVFTLTNGRDPKPGSAISSLASPELSEVRIWDGATGRQLRPPLRHSNPVRDVAVSADGQWLAATIDAAAIVWNLREGNALLFATNTCKLLPPIIRPDLQQPGAIESSLPDFPAPGKSGRRYESSQPGVMCLAFSPDSRRLVTVAGDSSGTIWSLAGGPPIALQPARQSGRAAAPWSPHAALFSPDGGQIFIADYSGEVRRWDVRTGEWVGQLEQKAEQGFLLSPDGLFVWIQDRLYDVETGELMSPAPLHWGCRSAAFSPDGQRVLTADDEGFARMWDLAGSVALPAPFRHDWPTVVRNSPAPEAAGQRTVDRGLQEEMRAAMSEIRAICFSADGSKVLTMSDNGSARVWDGRTGAPLGPYIRLDKPLRCGAFSRDGARFAVGGGYANDGVTQVWNTSTGAAAGPPLGYSSQVDRVELSPDGKWLVAQRQNAGELVDVETGKPVALAPNPGTLIHSLAFSPDGHSLVVCSGSPIETRADSGKSQDTYRWQTQVLQAGTWKALLTLADSNRVAAIQFSPNGRWLLTFAASPTIGDSPMSIANLVHSFRVWDAATGRPASPECALISSPFHTESVFDQDKGYLFLFAIGAQAVVWDLEKQRRVESGPWRGFRFSPRAMSLDLRRVAGNLDALTLYDTVTGDPLSPPLRKQTGPRAAYPVVFSPDGLRLVAGSGDRAQLWDLPPDYRPIEDLVSLAELMAGRCIGGSGDFNSPERAAVTACWQRLRLQYPDSFAVSSVQARRWRENLVESCEQTGRAFGAIFHLTFLANENPNDENLRQRLARARASAALQNVR